jgi:hypothetical protein
MVCYAGSNGTPCFNAVHTDVLSGLISYSQIEPYIEDADDKVLNISFNEVK